MLISLAGGKLHRGYIKELDAVQSFFSKSGCSKKKQPVDEIGASNTCDKSPQASSAECGDSTQSSSAVQDGSKYLQTTIDKNVMSSDVVKAEIIWTHFAVKKKF